MRRIKRKYCRVHGWKPHKHTEVRADIPKDCPLFEFAEHWYVLTWKCCRCLNTEMDR